MIIKSIENIGSSPLFFEMPQLLTDSIVYIKLEGLNIAGSIKLTTAVGLVDALEKEGKMQKDTILIESSSGNLGLALSIVCKARGYPFICVTDPNILPENEKLISAYGATLIKITQRDINGGFLGSRIKFINEYIEKHPTTIWLNQYANQNNPLAHFSKTAHEIFTSFSKIDFLFVGAGTTGTLMGCAKYFKTHSPQTKIVGVDALGSVTFGFPSKKRFIPGIGTSRKPEIAHKEYLDDIVLIDERAAVKMCRHLLGKYGLFLGGSSGSVVQAVYDYQTQIPIGSTVVAISPDFGGKYIDMVYDDVWIQAKLDMIV